MNFKNFANAVNEKINAMFAADGKALRVDVTRDELWETYLSSFPEGSNPIFRERTEHDCNCCKNFIRNIGDMVILDSQGEYISIWDVTIEGEPEYQAVADALSQHVKSRAIKGLYSSRERRVGNESTTDYVSGDFNHFWAEVPNLYVSQTPTSFR